MTALPDPDMQAEFYSGVTAKRLFAFLIDGARLDGGSALLHTVGYTVSMAVPILQIISILLMLTTARGQGLSDHMLGTVMLKRRA